MHSIFCQSFHTNDHMDANTGSCLVVKCCSGVLVIISISQKTALALSPIDSWYFSYDPFNIFLWLYIHNDTAPHIHIYYLLSKKIQIQLAITQQ